MTDIEQVARNAREASTLLQSITSKQKSLILSSIHDKLAENKQAILEANAVDKANAEQEVAAGKLSVSLFKRLDIEGKDGEKFETMLQGIKDVDSLYDPIGQVSLSRELDEGLNMYRVTCPVGVCLVIFEARPEVVVNIACLAIKSSNAVILKGGKEASATNQKLADLIREAIDATPTPEGATTFPANAVQLVSRREDIDKLLDQDRYIDLVVPRGSNSLVRYIQGHTRIPVLGHADGICSVYIDEFADVAKAPHIVVDAKTNYPAACNAAETLLVNSKVLKTTFTKVAQALFGANVILHADEASYAYLQNESGLTIPEGKLVKAQEGDFDKEFLDHEIAVRVVDSVSGAIEHINEHGSKHTDVIITENKDNAELFMRRVDAAGVYWNASSRFADGFRYGFGTEVGVSTNKTHARGPVGLEGLTIYKYRIYGNGQGAGDYGVGKGKRSFTHKTIPLDEVRNKFVI
ncbi:glutamate-5-semialdehyde dehydrogenase [Mycoemilia scoparia]|uniref:glutamate-5-semialdehyde dehydrogenase n=1 Tax=Mycoemilia scoparia TaxID=417184 RepID=A0A9W8A806_9FUNG|nr:glutamate-5-semialdehyde dehydrogenase [Mycoemilia scoparia]